MGFDYSLHPNLSYLSYLCQPFFPKSFLLTFMSFLFGWLIYDLISLLEAFLLCNTGFETINWSLISSPVGTQQKKKLFPFSTIYQSPIHQGVIGPNEPLGHSWLTVLAGLVPCGSDVNNLNCCEVTITMAVSCLVDGISQPFSLSSGSHTFCNASRALEEMV